MDLAAWHTQKRKAILAPAIGHGAEARIRQNYISSWKNNSSLPHGRGQLYRFQPDAMLRIVPSRMANEINIFFHQPLSKSGTAPVPAMLYTGSAMKHELKPVPFHFLFLHREKVRKREGMRNRDRRGEERRERERERERKRTSLDHFSKRSTSTGTSVLAALYRAAYKWWITNIDRTREGDKTSDEHRVWVNQGEKVGGRGRRTTEGWGKEGGGERDGGRRDREVVTPKGEAGKLFASRQAQKANLRMRCAGAATPMRPVGPSLDFDQV